ncbi:MAG: hypothetical protein ACR5KW_03400 [Wolbachia sp.]
MYITNYQYIKIVVERLETANAVKNEANNIQISFGSIKSMYVSVAWPSWILSNQLIA